MLLTLFIIPINIQANQWCANGVELLASQRIEKCSVSAELAEQSLHEIQAFIASASDFKLSSPSEFKKIFLESTTPETKALVSQVSISFIFILNKIVYFSTVSTKQKRYCHA